MIARFMTLALVLYSFVSVGYAEEHDEAWASRQVQRVKESDTNAWRRIPWTASLLDAREASTKEKRPVFLFTHGGNIETGRC